MIRCIPHGICSWNFVLDGDGHHADVQFIGGGEQGSITADGISFSVCKHGMFSGQWTLSRAGKDVVSGQKSSAFTRTFEIQDEIDTFVLRAESAIGRSFRIERRGNLIAQVVPVHAFTRRATIETFAQDCNFTIIAFSFWLTVLTWRRAANSNAGGGGG